ncbi:response regulator [Domibacillus sp. A3M-37]|uniref:response regulator n=1 Tax=Domibacillus sp. A3M-37 TaxID=2962037 RepID=UPI0020B6F848|nr:response regulator [Domibacillus sp. A3M-37]MCP3763764.1 response regulator [Domibacillus sp. A3M-37]
MFKVVIADDEALILKNLQFIIPWSDFQCEVVGTAKNGQEAYDLCEQHQADLLLTDISMPGMTGLELLKQLDRLPKKPLAILISGYDEFEYAREGLKYNALDYILKPVDYEELQQCVERGIQQLKEKAEREYEIDKHYLYELLILGSIQEEKTSFYKALIPVLIEKRDAVEQPVDFLFRNMTVRQFQYTLSAHAMIILVEWPTEELVALRNFLQDRNKQGHAILIGAPVITEDELKTSVEELQEWTSIHRLLDERVLFLEELTEKYQSKKSTTDSIGEAMRFIEEHFHEDISADQAAAHADMSVSYFSLLFKQVTGSTFLDYLTGYRMEKACFLLLHTQLKTYEIAEKVGYKDQRYFSQVFKKRLHQTPSEYRKQHMKS